MPLGPRPARSGWQLSLLVWLLCAVLGPGPALPALHFALVQHGVCPEHGELLHVATAGAPASAHGAADAGAAVPEPKGPLLQVGSREAPGAHGHEACAVSGAGNGVPLLPGVAAPLALLEQPHALAPPGAERAHASVALLRYAPKLAPPAPPASAPLAASVRV